MAVWRLLVFAFVFYNSMLVSFSNVTLPNFSNGINLDLEANDTKQSDAEEGREDIYLKQLREQGQYDCPTPVAPDHGKIIGDDYSLGSRITFVCDDGYVLSGRSEVMCVAVPDPFNQHGIWDYNGNYPECQKPHDNAGVGDTHHHTNNKRLVRSPPFRLRSGPAKRSFDDHAIYLKEEDLFPKTTEQETEGKLVLEPKFNGQTTESNVDNLCVLPLVVGPCRARKTRFYYDITNDECKKFYYGGCHGNKNNFLTLEKCQQTCGKKVR